MDAGGSPMFSTRVLFPMPCRCPRFPLSCLGLHSMKIDPLQFMERSDSSSSQCPVLKEMDAGGSPMSSTRVLFPMSYQSIQFPLSCFGLHSMKIDPSQELSDSSSSQRLRPPPR
ncbi:uncharacterized protein J3R85_001124 [Psidium guajava]|nr:uncharacterized protein J3R85_001124 [Psidium guajava]